MWRGVGRIAAARGAVMINSIAGRRFDRGDPARALIRLER
jgi:hypothetical protein